MKPVGFLLRFPRLAALPEAALLAGMPADVAFALALLLAEHPVFERLANVPILLGPFLNLHLANGGVR